MLSTSAFVDNTLLDLQNSSYYICTEIYTPKRMEIKIVSLRQRSQLIGHTIFFTSEKRRIDALIGYIVIFTSEKLSHQPFDWLI